MRHIASILGLFLIFSQCKTDVAKTERHNNSAEVYVQGTFALLDSLKLKQDDYVTINSYTAKKYSKTRLLLDSFFVHKYLCPYSNLCFGKKYQQEYYPVGRLKFGASELVVFERFERRHPFRFIEAHGIILNKGKFRDHLVLYYDDYRLQINCYIAYDTILISYIEPLNKEPENEAQVNYVWYSHIEEKIYLYGDSLITNQNLNEELIFDEGRNKWLNGKNPLK